MGSGKRASVAVILLLVGTASCARLPALTELPALAIEDAAFMPTVEAYAGAPARRGNRLDFLLNGDQIFPAQLKAIRSARKTITYAQYFYEDGPPARDIVEAIAERCLQGVRGHVLLDGVGSINMPPEFRETLEQAGCEVATFHPVNPFTVQKLNNRNHRRILVVDGRVGFTGGSGASSKWMGNGLARGQWRQTDVRVEGPVVGDLQAAFISPEPSPRGSASRLELPRTLRARASLWPRLARHSSRHSAAARAVWAILAGVGPAAGAHGPSRRSFVLNRAMA